MEKSLPTRASQFNPSPTACCRYIRKETEVYDYENREPKSSNVDYGLLTRISEIKYNLGIATSIVPIMLVSTCKNMMIGTNFGHVH